MTRRAIGVVALVLLGCGGASASGGGAGGGGGHTLPTATRAVTIPRSIDALSDSAHATVVVLCPAECGPYAIVDGSGAIVAEVGTRQRAVLQLPAGPVTLYALDESHGDRVSGEVAAGGVYYLAADVHTTGVRFVQLSPRSVDGRWDHVREYFADTEEREIDPDHRGELDEVIVTPQLAPRTSALDTRAGEMDAAHRDERTIQAADGTLLPPS